MTSGDPEDVLTRPAPPPDTALRYGPGAEHVADVRFPAAGGSGAGLVLLLHGGFWRVRYDRAHVAPLAVALAAENFVVCTPEYRRVGQPGGGWTGTFDDVAAAVDVLPGLVRRVVQGRWAEGRSAGGRSAGGRSAGGRRVGVTGEERPEVWPVVWPVVLAGHSAGGHLALWAAGRHRLAAGAPGDAAGVPADAAGVPADAAGVAGDTAGVPGDAAGQPWMAGVVALAPVSDLTACYRAGLGSGAAGRLLDGGPGEWPERYAQTDPARLVPLGAPVRIVHGSEDSAVPVEMSRDFAGRARTAGDDVVLRELRACGHFEVIDPLSAAWPSVLAAFRELAGGVG